MSVTRREFVVLAAGSSAAAGFCATAPIPLPADRPFGSAIKAVAFDAFPIFDPRPVLSLVNELFPGSGADLIREWRTRQFEYTWLRIVMRRYADFWQVTQDALAYACRTLKLDLPVATRDKLMQAYLALDVWPDVVPALDALKAAGMRMVLLSNFTPTMLEANLKRTGLGAKFERALSTDAARTYKPDPGSYQLGLDALKLTRQEILFVASAGWDAAGAKSFGYPAFWVNRQKLPPEELDAPPDAIGETLSDLVKYVGVA